MVEGGHHPRNRPPTLGTTSVDFYHYPVTVWAYSTPQPNTEVPAPIGGWWPRRKWFNLTHWGQMMHICINKIIIIGSDNGLLPGRRQVIIWTNAGILLIGLLGTNFSEIFIKIHTFSFKKMYLKMSAAKWWPFCLCLNVLRKVGVGKQMASILHKMATI